MTALTRAPAAPADELCLPHHVVVRSFVAETVLMDVNTGRYYKLDPVGGSLLEALQEHGTIGAAAEALAAAGWGSAAEVTAELQTLVDHLRELGLLHRVPRLP
jgi:hypothetical protein